MSQFTEFMNWWECAVEAEFKAIEKRKTIARDQLLMGKHQEVRLKLGKKKPVVLTRAEWRALLTSGKSRSAILRETGAHPRTIDNQADALGLPRP